MQEVARSMYNEHEITYPSIIVLCILRTSHDVIDDAIEQQKVNYFGLKSLIQTALQLYPLVRGPSSAMSILTGTEVSRV